MQSHSGFVLVRYPWGSQDNMRRLLKQPAASKLQYIQNGRDGGRDEVMYRSFVAWFYLCKIDLFIQNIFNFNFLYFICFWTYCLNCSANLRLFSRRLHRCLADHERASISRSFLCNRERLLVFERRETRCVKIICFWLQYEINPDRFFVDIEANDPLHLQLQNVKLFCNKLPHVMFIQNMIIEEGLTHFYYVKCV